MTKTLREAYQGKTLLRLVAVGDRFTGVAFNGGKLAAQIEGDDPDALWAEMLRTAGQADPSYIGYAEARARFLRYFPGGFASDAYVSMERSYKLVARDQLLADAPLEDVLTGSGFGEAAIRAFNRTNLVYPVEKARLRDALRGPDSDAFLQAAASFTLVPDASSLATMERILRKQEAARWTVVTYLPFLWAPDAHMYLKPQVTQDFARRVGHPFANHYESALRLDIYQSLLDLVTETERKIAVLNPRDRIDTQSFLWVVGEYRPGDEQPAALEEQPA